MPEIHFRYGGSTATRTMNCSEWRTLSEGMPKGKVSPAASRGTVGHNIFEKMINDETFEAESMLGEVHTVDGNKVTVDQKLIDLINEAIDLQEDFFDEHDMEVVHTETLFTHSELIGGSADVVAWNKERNIFAVIDLKTGAGNLIDAEDSQQLLFYGWLAVNHWAADFTFDGNTRVILGILQPVDRKEIPLDTWEVNVGDLIAWGKEFELAVRVAEGGLGEPTSGPWCSYCPVAATCPAKNALVDTSRRLPVDSDNLASLIASMAIVSEVESWCADVRKLCHEQLEAGTDVEGWKLVPKRATRVWNNPELALATFHKARKLKQEHYMDMKLLSPAQMEKACKRLKIDFKKYEDLFSSMSSGTTLARADDKRAAALPLEGMASAIAQLT